MVQTITNISHADYADKADYFKTLIALIFFDSENMRKSEKHENILFVRLVRLVFFFFEHESI